MSGEEDRHLQETARFMELSHVEKPWDRTRMDILGPSWRWQRTADHSDWDSALSYVWFAYNTSRQETTEQSPFFLMYGRHPVLPVDAISGADPDPVQIVSVESGPG